MSGGEIWPAHQVMSDFVDLDHLLTLTGYRRSAAYRAMDSQLLPRPVKVGRNSRWPLGEVLEVRAAILRGDDEGARAALVRRMLRERGQSLREVPGLDA